MEEDKQLENTKFPQKNISVVLDIKRLKKIKKEIGNKKFEERYRAFYNEVFERTMCLSNKKYIGHRQELDEYSNK